MPRDAFVSRKMGAWKNEKVHLTSTGGNVTADRTWTVGLSLDFASAGVIETE